VRALVTGGAGFIGSTLVDRLLAEGHAVDVIDDLSGGSLTNLAEARADRSAELHIHQVDVRSPEVVDLVARRAPEVVFHLAAAPDVDDVAVGALVEVVGSLHVLEGARRAGTRKVVYAAGWWLYGEPDAAALPLRESSPQAPLVARGAAEKAMLEYLRLFRERWGVEFTALALASVYGPRQRAGRGVVSTFARALLSGGELRVLGDGAQTRDFLYVDDAVDALVRAAERGSGLLVNVGRGVETSVRSLLATMADAAGTPGVTPSVGSPVSGSVARMALDPGRAKLHLGWEPWTTLEEGIAQTLQWHAEAVRT